jgi:hypothetical protein
MITFVHSLPVVTTTTGKESMTNAKFQRETFPLDRLFHARCRKLIQSLPARDSGVCGCVFKAMEQGDLSRNIPVCKISGQLGFKSVRFRLHGWESFGLHEHTAGTKAKP